MNDSVSHSLTHVVALALTSHKLWQEKQQLRSTWNRIHELNLEWMKPNLQLSAVNPISNLTVALLFINWNALLRASKLQVPKFIFGRRPTELYDSKLDGYRLQWDGNG